MANMTVAEWQKSPDLVAAWALTWEQRHMKIGLAVLLHHAIPKTLPRAVAGESILEHLALRAARDAGFFDFPRLIETLKKEYVPPPEGATEGWGDAARDHLPDEQNLKID